MQNSSHRHWSCFRILAILVLWGGLCSDLLANPAPRAVEGLLDLRQWNWQEEGSVNLEGEWAFFWDQLLEPGQLTGTSEDYLALPGPWKGSSKQGTELATTGYATYQLQILLPAGEEILVLKVPPIRSAFRLWANGELLGASGEVGTSKEAYFPSYHPQILALSTKGQSLELVLQAANFHHRNGGPGFPIEIGTHDQVVRQNNNADLYEIFLMASLFMMALYHFGLFLIRSKETAALFFALYCTFSFLRVPLEGQYIFCGLFPGTDLTIWLRVDYLTILGVGLFFCMFLARLFPAEWHRWATRVILIGLAIFCLLIFVLPLTAAAWYIPLIQGFILLGGIYCIYIMVQAMRHKRQGAPMLLIAVVVFLGFYINDILFYSNQLATTVLTTSASFFFIIIQAFLLYSRFSNAYSLTEVYANIFQKFVPIQFLDRIAKNGISSIALGNASAEAAVILFSDIRGFTALSERMSPEKVFKFLNEYLSMMEPSIRENQGFVDKYLGDAIMALFTGDDGELCAQNALWGALGMKTALDRFNAKREARGEAKLESGIGLHFGKVIIGTVGGGERMDSTAIGDSVNLASRIEGATKIYGVRILVTEDVINAIGSLSPFRVRCLDLIRVIGRQEPIGIWEVSGTVNDPGHAMELAAFALFDKAREHYVQQEFTLALEKFQAFLQLYPGDRPAQIYVDRCREWMDRDRVRDWDGVTELRQK